MTYLWEILDPALLSIQMTDGWVRSQTHPDFPSLRIYNYTEKTQFEKHWNEATRMCRGLIVDTETWEVLARPFPKIHNFDEAEAPRIVDNQILYHWDNKWDGSLGIVYRRPDDKLAVATRGSFASEQAIKATTMIRDAEWATIEGLWQSIDSGYTPLFEIIYPENRIVIDYGGETFLAPLGFIEIATGGFTPHQDTFHEKRTMYNLLMDLSRENSEGWVAWLTPWKAVKIKQADYVELHRIVTGLSAKEVWRQLSAGTYDDFAMKLPDEFYAMVEEMRGELEASFTEVVADLHAFYSALGGAVGRGASRKDQAIWINANIPPKYRGLMFLALDARDYRPAIWKMVEPVGKMGLVDA